MLLRAGEVILRALSATGDETTLGLRGPESLLGLEAVEDAPSPVEVRAATDVTVCAIDPSLFRRWLGPERTPAATMLSYAVQEAGRRGAERVSLTGDASARVARFLLDRFEATERKAIEVPLQVVASLLSMRPETLSRILSQFRSAGALAPGRTVMLADIAQLRALAGDQDE
jgi:CRP-like cAMP-binding protein